MSGSKNQHSNLFERFRSRFELTDSSDSSDRSRSSDNWSRSRRDLITTDWEFDIANQNAISDFINPLKHGFFLKFNGLEVWYLGGFGVADYESELKIQNLKGRDQFGRQKCKVTWLKWCVVLRGFGVADESKLKIQKFKWQLQYSGLKCKKLLNWDEIWYLGDFGVADYESELNIQKKLKMADPTWLTKMRTVIRLGSNLEVGGFAGRWLQMRAQQSEIQNGGCFILNFLY